MASPIRSPGRFLFALGLFCMFGCSGAREQACTPAANRENKADRGSTHSSYGHAAYGAKRPPEKCVEETQ